MDEIHGIARPVTRTLCHDHHRTVNLPKEFDALFCKLKTASQEPREAAHSCPKTYLCMLLGTLAQLQ